MSSQSRGANHRRALLASLSTAGMALVGGSEAEAGIVLTTVNQDVGWVNGVQSADFIGALPGFYGLNAIKIHASNGSSYRSLLFNNPGSVYIKAHGGTASGHGRFAVIAEKGQKWSGIGINSSNFRAQIATNTSGGNPSGIPPFTEKFFAFKFNIGTTNSYRYRYGWLEASLTNRSFSNLFLHIDSYAYDDTGAQIAMGDAGVPEPSSAIQLLALAAMTSGAAGVRRWKAVKAGRGGEVA
jgi:hypothetical protein